MKNRLWVSIHNVFRARYEHDCCDCTFLGKWHEYDLYHCPQNGFPTVVGRYGNAPSEYTSGLGLSIECLQVAQKRALARGLSLVSRAERERQHAER